MLNNVLDMFARLGVVEGMTFRCVQQEGVGMLIEPNPTPNRMSPNAVPVPTRRPARITGDWNAKPYHETR